SAVGNKIPALTSSTPVSSPPPSSAATISVNAPGAAAAAPRPAAAPLPPPSGAAAIPGGSEVYRIDPNGYPRRVWSHSQDVVYAIAFDSAGRVLLGAGNRGSIYRIESPTQYTALLSVPVTQVTAFQTGSGGRIYAASGNTG